MATSMKASINNNPSNIKSIYTSILSVNEMNHQRKITPHETIIPQSLLKSFSASSNDNQDSSGFESKLTLIAALRNALINKDTDSFLFCLTQTDKVLIENTIKGLDNETIKMFIEKLIDLFQRSMIYKLNIPPWMSNIIKYHSFVILSMDNDVIQNLGKIKALIENYTKNYAKLVQLKKKLDCINALGVNLEGDDSMQLKGTIEPLLQYEESDDEEEREKKKKRNEALSNNGIKLFNEEDDNDNQNEDNPNNIMDIDNNDDENYFDIEDEIGENEGDQYNSDSQNKIAKKKKDNEEEEGENNDLDSNS